jgi:hypothetical protein
LATVDGGALGFVGSTGLPVDVGGVFFTGVTGSAAIGGFGVGTGADCVGS